LSEGSWGGRIRSGDNKKGNEREKGETSTIEGEEKDWWKEGWDRIEQGRQSEVEQGRARYSRQEIYSRQGIAGKDRAEGRAERAEQRG